MPESLHFRRVHKYQTQQCRAVKLSTQRSIQSILEGEERTRTGSILPNLARSGELSISALKLAMTFAPSITNARVGPSAFTTAAGSATVVLVTTEPGDTSTEQGRSAAVMSEVMMSSDAEDSLSWMRVVAREHSVSVNVESTSSMSISTKRVVIVIAGAAADEADVDAVSSCPCLTSTYALFVSWQSVPGERYNSGFSAGKAEQGRSSTKNTCY